MDIGFNLGVAVVCFSIVFLVLVGLSYIIVLQRIILRKIEGKSSGEIREAADSITVSAPEARLAETPDESDDDEIIAVITAAIAAAMGKTSSQIIVKSIRRAGQLDRSWAMSGRRELMESRF